MQNLPSEDTGIRSQFNRPNCLVIENSLRSLKEFYIPYSNRKYYLPVFLILSVSSIAGFITLSINLYFRSENR